MFLVAADGLRWYKSRIYCKSVHAPPFPKELCDASSELGFDGRDPVPVPSAGLLPRRGGRAAAAGRVPESTPRRDAPAAMGSCNIGWISLSGVVGPIPDAERFFTAADLDKAFDRAEKSQCNYIVLEIDSPGGRVDSCHAIIERIILAQERGITVVAVVRNAGSAAALIAMACKEIAVVPQARIRAAVMVAGGTSVKKILEEDPEYAAKFRSFSDALPRAAARQAGRSSAIVDAMTDSKYELWFCPEAGVSGSRSSASARCVDDASSVLTLTADQTVEFGIGRSIRTDDVNDRGLRKTLSLPEEGKKADFTNQVEVTARKLRELMKKYDSKTGGRATSSEGKAKILEEIEAIEATP